MRASNCGLILLACVGLLSIGGRGSAAAPGNRWVTLFNGKDLSGWTMGPDKSWAVRDGVITLVRSEMDGKEHNADYLWTKDSYGDFILELEFRVPARANSGVFLRTSDLKDPVYSGFEIQVSNSFGQTTLSRTGTAGAIYDCVAPVKNAIRAPGAWNRYRITCRGSRIAVELNGERVAEMDVEAWSKTGKNPDGTPNKFKKPMKDFARRGHVGLQDHGRPVEYRAIRIQPVAE